MRSESGPAAGALRAPGLPLAACSQLCDVTRRGEPGSVVVPSSIQGQACAWYIMSIQYMNGYVCSGQTNTFVCNLMGIAPKAKESET